MKPAFGYVRVSGADQLHGDGPVRQDLAIRQHAQQCGYQLERVFTEQVTGTTETRAAFAELLEAVKVGTVRVVIIEKLDRLARDLMVSEALIAQLQKLGVTLISTAEPDLAGKDPTRKFIRQVLGAVAELDKSLIVARMRAARDRARVKNGRCEGRKPYGHYEGEGAIAERIRAIRAGGATLTAIADQLNGEGIKPRGGSQWYPSTIRKIVVTSSPTIFQP